MTLQQDVLYPPRRLLIKPKLNSIGLRSVLLGTIIAVAVTGFLTGSQLAASTRAPVENELLTLLRFMAVVKLCAALTGGALAYWRFGSQVNSGFAAALIAATALMAAAPGLIWAGVFVGLAALLFYMGLFTFLGLALKDTTSWISSASSSIETPALIRRTLAWDAAD